MEYDNLIFGSEKDANSIALWEWMEHNLEPGILQKYTALSVHSNKELVKQLHIRKLPTLVKNGDLITGQNIIIFLKAQTTKKEGLGASGGFSGSMGSLNQPQASFNNLTESSSFETMGGSNDLSQAMLAFESGREEMYPKGPQDSFRQ